MTITIGITIAAFAGAAGFMLCTVAMATTPDPPLPQALPEHEHLWCEWEQDGDPAKLYTADGDWYADEYLQRRQCATCGWVEHHATRI